MNLEAIRAKKSRFAIGLMSGTSCDGVNAVLVRIKGTGPGLAIKLLAHQTFPYTTDFQNKLLVEHMSAKEVCLLNFELGQLLAEASLAMLDQADDHEVEVDFIAAHGHTVGHYPPGSGNDRVGTLQIGEPAIIAHQTKLPVISDFRVRDMAAGGQGAPLVPYADWLLFQREEKNIVCLNIGGIANFTVVTPKFEDILAFDTGPGNIAIDATVRLLSRGSRAFDENGDAARRGKVIDEFLEYLLSDSYFQKEPPKSTGRERFGLEAYLRDALASRRNHSYEDLVATVTEATVRSIADAYRNYIAPNYEATQMIVGGGGAMNNTIMTRLQQELPEMKIFISDRVGISYDAREAIAFAILGNETIFGTPANVPQATGASESVVLGKITPP
ncbi:MAG TPA: anhydro-N-acetylmuramic acid kinase [Candidatus Hydrogenedentes bacterium]|mgnify:CR=1 FL=1|jgi:anhydro-N-acetylmuramic acid kinase|nr:MAG: Anhydro-N-acetylmuramic acid kinase [Candidatus Hydrogenedentes bacterium ADurb.Bin170]HNZ48730.1 anhydro-N-acetylmuramic acid kinase [Candidatus Hydrogenedentota bacterium]HOD95227.1 anhydro-N-acetylmuramic acid kinase [Candidatus Hydrogenedentota bacterium]HOH43524.1 anhydro-N-acetylmuramic acid kinase [Candidatus Hydrogenedentota bacterium]HOM47910.1 anhydro-N-acetylmuramic acid kinase [Candidatus Hydrogenedentota bacterium]